MRTIYLFLKFFNSSTTLTACILRTVYINLSARSHQKFTSRQNRQKNPKQQKNALYIDSHSASTILLLWVHCWLLVWHFGTCTAIVSHTLAIVFWSGITSTKPLKSKHTNGSTFAHITEVCYGLFLLHNFLLHAASLNEFLEVHLE